MSFEPDETLFRRIIVEVEDKQGFLHRGLSLTSLTREVLSNRSYVSHCINFYSGLSVPDFINSYRIRYIQECFDGGRKDPVPIQYRCGFSSDASYIRNFRRFTGYSPKEWQVKNGFY